MSDIISCNIIIIKMLIEISEIKTMIITKTELTIIIIMMVIMIIVTITNIMTIWSILFLLLYEQIKQSQISLIPHYCTLSSFYSSFIKNQSIRRYLIKFKKVNKYRDLHILRTEVCKYVSTCIRTYLISP